VTHIEDKLYELSLHNKILHGTNEKNINVGVLKIALNLSNNLVIDLVRELKKAKEENKHLSDQLDEVITNYSEKAEKDADMWRQLHQVFQEASAITKIAGGESK